jgi:hypothetical protein
MDCTGSGTARLLVKNSAGIPISENLYWINLKDDYKALDQLPAANLTATVTTSGNNGKTKYLLNITNPGDHIAFMISCKLQGARSSKELLPTLWNKNYVTLLPKETIQLEAEINNLDLIEEPAVYFKAYNMDKPLIIDIEPRIKSQEPRTKSQ